MSRETSNLGLILYDPSEDKNVKVRDVINKVLGFTDSNTIKIDTKTKDIDTNIKTLHDSIIGTDGNVVFYNKQEVLLAVHPVGSIFLSTDGAEPAELYGGTWEQIKDAFLLAAGDTYAAGSTGGSANHNHSIGDMFASLYYMGDYVDYNYSGNTAWSPNYKNTSPGGTSVTETSGITYYGGATVYGSPTKEANNLPPYYSVYIWRRVA